MKKGQVKDPDTSESDQFVIREIPRRNIKKGKRSKARDESDSKSKNYRPLKIKKSEGK